MREMTQDRRHQLVNVLDSNLRQLELTETQQKQLESAYGHVTDWLADSPHPVLAGASLYPQGSVRLRTTVKPLARDEFDVDLVCYLPHASHHVWDANGVYQLVGDRLKGKETFRRMLKAHNRCWRLEYAESSKFHMDITPAIPNPRCQQRGILVPDREHRAFKPSNPVRFADIFDGISQLAPTFLELRDVTFAEAMARAAIEPLPDHMQEKDLLRRIVQVAKRHRDIYFQEASGKPPISVIITTLAMRAYGDMTRRAFETPWDFVIEVARAMPAYIETRPGLGHVVPNPSAPDENFADKWARDPAYAVSFYRWHAQFVADLEAYAGAEGLDQLSPILRERLIGVETDLWRNRLMSNVNGLRKSRGLYRAGGGLGLNALSGVAVPKNTFFGDR